MRRATLLIIQGAEQGARFDLADRPITIGRSVNNEVRIHDTEVSRLHASIQTEDDAFVVTDRNSSNGTYVNGQLVRSRVLAHGDQVQIGRTVLLFTDPTTANTLRQAAERVEIRQTLPLSEQSSIVSRLPLGREPMADLGSLTSDRHLLQLKVLYRIGEETVRPFVSIEQLLERILRITLDATGADHACVMLIDPETQEAEPRAMCQRAEEAESRLLVSRSIVDYVLTHQQGIRTTDAQHDARFEQGQSILRAGIREAMCVPMPGRHGLLGAVYVDITTSLAQSTREGRFQEDSLRLLLAIGRQAALAVETMQYQQALVQAERMAAMGQTIASLSHHIKNILQGVRGGSYLIDLGLNDHNEDLVRKGWGLVERNQDKIYHLVMDMLTFSKERKPLLELAQLNDVVAEVHELMRSRADECGVTFEVVLDEGVPDSTFDPEGLHRAILNVVVNAIDAVEGQAGAAVTMSTGWQTDGDLLWVRVRDNGPGIAADQLKRIFHMFESTKGARGTGLGLAVSQKILREHAGEIFVESVPGAGAEFTLRWPRVADDPQAGALRHTQVG